MLSMFNKWMNKYVLPYRSKTCLYKNLCFLFPRSSLSNCFHSYTWEYIIFLVLTFPNPDSSYSSAKFPTVEIRSNASRTNLIGLWHFMPRVSWPKLNIFKNLSSLLCFHRAKILKASSVVSMLNPKRLWCQSLCSQPCLMPKKSSAKGLFPIKSNKTIR